MLKKVKRQRKHPHHQAGVDRLPYPDSDLVFPRQKNRIHQAESKEFKAWKRHALARYRKLERQYGLAARNYFGLTYSWVGGKPLGAP